MIGGKVMWTVLHMYLKHLNKYIMAHNKDYRKELKGVTPIFNQSRKCPNCSKRLVALPPDRAWCEDVECNYGEMHIVGGGVLEAFKRDKILNRK